MSRSEERPLHAFRASREGLARVLGDLEAEVMEFLWSSAGGPVSAREVWARVGEERGVKQITIVTVLNNLCRKGLLGRERRGRAFRYEPRVSREAFLRRVSEEVLSGMIRLAPEVAVSSFVDVLAELDPAALDRLRRRLAALRRGEGG